MPLYSLGDRRPTLPDDGSVWIAPNAQIVGDVRIGRGVTIWFGVVIRADNGPMIIGDGTNIQENSVLHSDPPSPLTIGANCTIGHQAMLHGCTIGDGSLIGIGAIVLNDAVIGSGCLVGAGALVTERKRFEDGMLIVGSPAQAARALTAEQRAGLGRSAHHYVERGRVFAEQLREVAYP